MITLPYTNDFESELTSDWNTGGPWKTFGDWYTAGIIPYNIGLNTNVSYCHGGSKSLIQTIDGDENRGAGYLWLSVPVSEIYIRGYLYFKSTYSHALGQKILQMGNHTGAVYNWQIVSHMRGTGTQPRTLNTLQMNFNGGPYDWGTMSANDISAYADNTWLYIEWYIKLNTPGLSDGIVRVWFKQDGQSVSEDSPQGERTGLNIQGDNSWNINQLIVGGWYSNSGVDPNPSPAIRYIDDVAISTSWIGPTGGGSTPSSIIIGAGGSISMGSGGSLICG